MSGTSLGSIFVSVFASVFVSIFASLFLAHRDWPRVFRGLVVGVCGSSSFLGSGLLRRAAKAIAAGDMVDELSTSLSDSDESFSEKTETVEEDTGLSFLEGEAADFADVVEFSVLLFLSVLLAAFASFSSAAFFAHLDADNPAMLCVIYWRFSACGGVNVGFVKW